MGKPKKKLKITSLHVIIAIGLVLLIFIMIYEGITGGPAAIQETLPEDTAQATEPPTTEPEPVFRTERQRAEYQIRKFAEEYGIHYTSYPDKIVDLLENNPETEEFVKEYPLEYGHSYPAEMEQYANTDGVPLFLQWDRRWGYIIYGSDVAGLTGAGPMCLSMAGYYLTRDPAMSPDNMIAFALENGYSEYATGSAWALIEEGAEKLGLQSTEIPLVRSQIKEYLQNGDVIICAVGEGIFAETSSYLVLTGWDDNGIRLNDPNSKANSGKYWDYDELSGEITNLWLIVKA